MAIPSFCVPSTPRHPVTLTRFNGWKHTFHSIEALGEWLASKVKPKKARWRCWHINIGQAFQTDDELGRRFDFVIFNSSGEIISPRNIPIPAWVGKKLNLNARHLSGYGAPVPRSGKNYHTHWGGGRVYPQCKGERTKISSPISDENEPPFRGKRQEIVRNIRSHGKWHRSIERNWKKQRGTQWKHPA